MSDTSSLVRVEIADRTASLILNRPDKRNALNDTMLEQLLDGLDRIEADAGVQVLLLRGEGQSFCSGVDLAEKLADRGAAGVVEYTLLLEAFTRLEHHPNPTVAVLQGTSLAGGWELALHCDVRFGTPESTFGMPLVRLGLVAPYPAASRLLQMAGASAATDLLLSGNLIDGTCAHQLGLVTHLVDSARLQAVADDYVARMSTLAPLALRETKRVLAHALRAPQPESYAEFDEARRTITRSEDTAEGLRAFLERRAPVFKGR